MTDFGAIPTNSSVNVVSGSNYVETTSTVTTTSATLADITGLTMTVTLSQAGRIRANMSVQTSTTGGAPATGGWAISINSVDGTEMSRYLSGTNDRGSLSVQSQVTGLGAGTYTVKGRHRRISGSSTINTAKAQLSALAILD